MLHATLHGFDTSARIDSKRSQSQVRLAVKPKPSAAWCEANAKCGLLRTVDTRELDEQLLCRLHLLRLASPRLQHRVLYRAAEGERERPRGGRCLMRKESLIRECLIRKESDHGAAGA